jgi:hypothetical protein
MDFIIQNVSELESLSRKVRWQYFERLVAFIFEQNNFKVEHNKVIVFPEGKRQFDVIAKRFDKIFAVECKKQQHLQISAAMDKHAERSLLLSEKLGQEVIPVIVTLCDEVEDAALHVIPLLKLNSFLSES